MPKTAENLDTAYRSLKSLLVEFEAPGSSRTLKGRSASELDFDLWSVPDAAAEERSSREVFFAGIRRQKTFVGFYYFPIYSVPSLAASLAPSLVRLLKGKSCFHIRSLDGDLLDQIRRALQVGLEDFQKRGWV